jgi:outer membrane protein TolC
MPDPKVTTVTREHRAEAARLLGHNPEHWIRHSLYGDWLETGDTSRLNSAMPTVAQALADRDARIGELEKSNGLLRGAIHRLEAAELAALAELDEAKAERDALQRHYDAAGPEHNLLALLDHYHDRIMLSDNACANAREQLARVVGALREQTRLTASALVRFENFAERRTMEIIRFPSLEAALENTNVILKELDHA